MKKLLIFGSTGSVGENSLDVIRKSRGEFKVIGLCANKDADALRRQIEEFRPSYVCIKDQYQAKRLKNKINGKIKLFSGEKGLEEFAAIKSDMSIMAISGISCLKPLFINMRHTKRIALANKESVVTAGRLVFREAEKFNTDILPVDSEINALFQLFSLKDSCRERKNIFRKVYITASGGALAEYNKKDLCKVTAKKVLNHPTWKMGKRVTVDSATLVNKGFEVVETHYFFGLPYENIGILMHKESVIHALVEFTDNTIFSCIYQPDMRVPISYSLYYPKRCVCKAKDNFKNKFFYSFEPINYHKYPLLKIILKAAKRKDNSLVVLNACDEVVIDYFLQGKVKFTDIHKAINYIFNSYPKAVLRTIDDVFFWDKWARTKTEEYLNIS